MYFSDSFPIFKKLFLYFFKKKKVLIASFYMLIATIGEILGPVFISSYIQQHLKNNIFSYTSVFYLSTTFISIQIVSLIFNYLQTIKFSNLSNNAIEKIRKDVMYAALNQPLYIFDTQSIGQIITKITNDTEALKDFYEILLTSILKNLILFIIMSIVMCFLNWKMALISLSIVPAIFLILIFHKYYSQPIIFTIKQSVSQINQMMSEMINGISLIQQFQQEKQFLNKIYDISKIHYIAKIKNLKIDSILLRPLLSLISTIILCGLIVRFQFYKIGCIEVSLLYTFINYLSRLNEPIIALANQQSFLQQSLVSAKRVFELIESPIKKYGEKDKIIKEGKIEIKNLNFKYYKKKEYALKNINIQIPSKKFVALVGKTGSGKSTLAKLLMGYYPTENKNIIIDNYDLKEIKKRNLKNTILMVPQEPTILCDSVLNNITLGRKYTIEKINKIIELVDLKDFIQKLPKKIHTFLKSDASNLSQGEKQLIGISRVLLSKPKILIFDEATANLDSESEKKIQKALENIRKNTTVIVIAHRLSTIINADTIFVLDKGEIIERGNHKKLMKNKNKYWKMKQNYK